jgi:hypothetical protein
VIAAELGYVSPEESEPLLLDAAELGRILNALMSSVKSSARVLRPDKN